MNVCGNITEHLHFETWLISQRLVVGKTEHCLCPYQRTEGWLLLRHATATAKSLQLCPTLCDPVDGSPPGSAVPGILQARIVEWVAISFSNAWKWKAKVKSLSRVRLFETWDFPGNNTGVGCHCLLPYACDVPLKDRPLSYSSRNNQWAS